ncbi:MAG: indolepyruvate oxidoreductase subunit beta [Bacillota bacterium]
MAKKTNVLLVGVGGQGIVLAGKILSLVALEMGMYVKVSEIHGMSQRGGSVVGHIRLGEQVYSPIIPRGAADLILAFEKLEALRWLSYLRKGGEMIINDQEIDPMPVIVGTATYPLDIPGEIRKSVNGVVVVKAGELAQACGNAKAGNMVLLGVLAQRLGIAPEAWIKAISEVVPKGMLETNLSAFTAGLNYQEPA